MAGKSRILVPVALGALTGYTLNGAYAHDGPLKRVVRAAGPDQPKPILVKPSQLPIYGDPEADTLYEYVEAEISSFERGISAVRKATWDFMHSIEGTTSVVTDKFAVAKAHTTDLIDYVKQDPNFVPRISVIAVAGLGGIVAGYRGGPLRKTLYCAVGMTSATALCYPNEAVNASSAALQRVKDNVRGLWKSPDAKQKSATASPGSQGKNETLKEEKKESNTSQKVESKILQPATSKGPVKVDESQMDFGQSKPEDKEMYSTRE